MERGDGVARAIAALPRRERDVLLLKYDQGYGNSEIGKLLGLRPVTYPRSPTGPKSTCAKIG